MALDQPRIPINSVSSSPDKSIVNISIENDAGVSIFAEAKSKLGGDTEE